MPIVFLFVIVAGGWLGYVFVEHWEHLEQRDEFVERCIDKGGVTLVGFRPHGRWIGCFDAKEIENE